MQQIQVINNFPKLAPHKFFFFTLFIIDPQTRTNAENMLRQMEQNLVFYFKYSCISFTEC